MQTAKKLWTRDFTIITLGSAVSMLGNAMAGFAVSLFVLDYTNTPMLYALYVFLYTLPQILAPILAGPLIDRFSRRTTIYSLDFLSAAVYLTMGLLILFNMYSFTLLAFITFIIGTINSVYNVAFTSFYPLLITEGNYSKAYSVSSTIETLSYVMVPVATFLYKSFGIYPIMLANFGFFTIAALFETRISKVETTSLNRASYSAKAYISDSKEGMKYLISEKGLLFIALFFVFTFFANGASYVITLPWFRESYSNGEYIYMSVWVFMGVGRILGGFLQYKWKLPAKAKFKIFLFGYIISFMIEGSYLFSTLNIMRASCFLIGLINNTAYNIRISSTQNYVPHDMKGRFNGAFLMLTTVGSLLGELCAGALVSFLPMRASLAIVMGVAIISAIVFIGGGRKNIKPIFNRQA